MHVRITYITLYYYIGIKNTIYFPTASKITIIITMTLVDEL